MLPRKCETWVAKKQFAYAFAEAKVFRLADEMLEAFSRRAWAFHS